MTDARLTIDLDALAHNQRMVKRRVGGAEVAPAVKADAYGLGAGPVARRLWDEGVTSFFVARLSEGEALRRDLGERPVTLYVLDGATAQTAGRLKAANLIPVLNSVEQAAAWREVGGPCVLHVDTGMNRLGVAPSEIGEAQGLDVRLVMSHLACGGDPSHPMNARQLAVFTQVRAQFPAARASLANSAGVYLGPDFHFDLVRPGISIVGGGPFGVPEPELKAVAHFEAPILQIRALSPGDVVGYGATWTAERPVRAATIAAGYADSILRSASPGGAAWFEGARLPFLGRISMDLITLDLTDAPQARAGDFVELVGPNMIIDTVAKGAGTIAFEILVRLGRRAERTYVGGRD